MRDTDINCPPYAPVLMESTRAIGYSIEAAVADIIDNSIAAQATDVSIIFSSTGIPYIAIVDDGNGMDGKELTEAMRYGSCNPLKTREENDLGRYGLGMKTASLSQCKCLSVVSKKNGITTGRRWDLDYIADTKSWSLQQLSDAEIEEVPCSDKLINTEKGTVVAWQNLDKIKLGSLTLEKSLETKMDDVKRHLELVFHRYLSGDGGPRLNISINGVKLEPFDPFFTSKSSVPMDDEKIEIPGRDGQVRIRTYILPHPSKMTKKELEMHGGKDGLRTLQGFYIYRNRRLLTWGTWFKLVRMDEFSKLTRVRVDIPNSLDDLWTLDIKKATAYPPEVVKTRLKQLVDSMTIGSKRTWTFRQRKEISTAAVHVWDKVESRDGIRYVVNLEHPVLTLLKGKLNTEENDLLLQYLETIQNNLPFNNLHFDMHSDAKILQDKEEDEKCRVLFMSKAIIRNAIGNGNLEEVMNNLASVEPFMYYMDDIKKVCAEVKING